VGSIIFRLGGFDPISLTCAVYRASVREGRLFVASQWRHRKGFRELPPSRNLK
jgi:hypothetical protein